MFDITKPASKYVMLATGLLATVAFAIGISGFSSDVANAEGAFGGIYALFMTGIDFTALPLPIDVVLPQSTFVANSVLFSYIAMMLFFGILPLLKGTQKVICTFICKTEQ